MATKDLQDSSKEQTPKKALISSTRSSVVDNFKSRRKNEFEVDQVFKSILNGNITALSRAITLIESTKLEDKPKAEQLLQHCLPYSNRSLRIGITGVPGVGKSTFIESLGSLVATESNKIAVLAPSFYSVKS